MKVAGQLVPVAVLVLTPAVISAMVAGAMGATALHVAATAFLIACLAALSWTDAASQTVPDGLTFPLVLCGLAFSAAAGQPIFAASLCAGILSATALLQDRLGWDRRSPIGSGDYLLLAGAVAWLGLRAVPDLIIITAVLLGLHAIILRQPRIAMAPSLSLATATLWFGDLIP